MENFDNEFQLGQDNDCVKKTANITRAVRTVIDLPNNRRHNWNQFYSSIQKICGVKGCSLTCALDIANMFGPNVYLPNELQTFWSGKTGYSWDLPSGCRAKISKAYTTGLSSSGYYDKIRTEINNNRPVIIRLSRTEGGEEKTHFVVAYGYTGEGKSNAEIKVFDPAQKASTPVSQQPINGRNTTLANAVSWNGKNMNGIKFVSGTMAPPSTPPEM